MGLALELVDATAYPDGIVITVYRKAPREH
jgi:hypothetical protein